MVGRLVDRLGVPVSPPVVRMVGRDAVPPGVWTRHWHYPLPVTPLYADFEFGAHLTLSNVVGAEQHDEITAIFPTRHDRRTIFLVVDGYVYRQGNRREVRNPGVADPLASDDFSRGGVEYEMWRRWREEVKPRALEELGRFRAVELAHLSDVELLEHIRALSLYLVEGWAQIHTPSQAYKLMRERCAAFCKRHLGLTQTAFLELLNGCSETTAAPVTAMERVAERVLGEPALRAALGRDDPWTDPGIRAALAEYVEAYGHKATDWEYVTPTLAERPARVVALLRDAVTRIKEGKAGANDRVNRRRTELESRLRAQLPSATLRARFDALLRDAQETFGIGEEGVNLYNQGGGFMRYALLEAGARLVARGRLSARERVLFLRRPELESLLAGEEMEVEVEGLPGLADERWELYEAQKKLEAPQTVYGVVSVEQYGGTAAALDAHAGREVGPRDAATVGGEVRGIGASPGTYEGPARVVLTEDQFEEVQPGDVLVSPQTTPSWTILFGRIGALVTDDGGMLSHSAVASREFGIPAVLSTGVATSALVTGQRVRVDGASGVVTAVTAVTAVSGGEGSRDGGGAASGAGEVT